MSPNMVTWPFIQPYHPRKGPQHHTAHATLIYSQGWSKGTRHPVVSWPGQVSGFLSFVALTGTFCPLWAQFFLPLLSFLLSFSLLAHWEPCLYASIHLCLLFTFAFCMPLLLGSFLRSPLSSALWRHLVCQEASSTPTPTPTPYLTSNFRRQVRLLWFMRSVCSSWVPTVCLRNCVIRIL